LKADHPRKLIKLTTRIQFFSLQLVTSHTMILDTGVDMMRKFGGGELLIYANV